ncbi:MAG: flagellar motor protein MotB [Cryobacterium sp.]
MSSRQRQRQRRTGLDESGDEHPDERWMASYMDMVTVLMCMFIVLFAMSSVDQGKYEQLADSLATGFGVVDRGEENTVVGVVVAAGEPATVDSAPIAADITDLQRAVNEVASLSALKESVEAGLAVAGLSNAAEFIVNERGLTVGLVGSESYFAPDSADLSAEAVAIINAMAPALVGVPNEISVEGHADVHGQSVNYATDWELSAARAARVLRQMLGQGGIAQGSISAVGYGSARPSSTGSALADMAQNRRVDIVVLSDLPEDVRAIIPGVIEQHSPPA